MKRKIGIALAFFLLVTFVTFLFFTYKKQNDAISNLYQLVPIQSKKLIQVNSKHWNPSQFQLNLIKATKDDILQKVANTFTFLKSNDIETKTWLISELENQNIIYIIGESDSFEKLKRSLKEQQDQLVSPNFFENTTVSFSRNVLCFYNPKLVAESNLFNEKIELINSKVFKKLKKTLNNKAPINYIYLNEKTATDELYPNSNIIVDFASFDIEIADRYLLASGICKVKSPLSEATEPKADLSKLKTNNWTNFDGIKIDYSNDNSDSTDLNNISFTDSLLANKSSYLYSKVEDYDNNSYILPGEFLLHQSQLISTNDEIALCNFIFRRNSSFPYAKKVIKGSTKTWEVIDYRNNHPQILVQDELFNLYLIEDGDTLWNINLDSPITGSVVQLDVFNNNKLQMAFCTQKKFYIIDRLGRNVDHFPIVSKNDINTGISILDYDNNKKYRFIISSGKQLLNYDTKGDKVKGWNTKKYDNKIIFPPQHFIIGKKDYIFTFDIDGKILLLDRRGNIRHTPSTKISNPVDVKSIQVKKGANIQSTKVEITYSNGTSESYILT